MKFRIAALFSFLVLTSVLIIGCPGKNSPSSPSASAPTDTFTATNTACTDGSGHTCTFTVTPTATETATSSPTGTPTNTATVTDTRTPTATTTNTGTPTLTGTPSSTATITNTPTNSGTPTQTGTPTNTIPTTPTSTATNSPTGTPSPTYSPTPDCTGTYSISGNITYTGPTSGGSSAYVYAIQNPGGGGNNSCNPPGTGLSGGTSGSYSLTYLPSGSYYVIAFYGALPGNSGPPLGSNAAIYNAGNPACSFSPSEKVNASTNPTGINLTFSNTYQLWGVNAAVTYTGSNSNGGLQVGLFSGVNTSTGAYTLITENGGNGGSNFTTGLIDTTTVCGGGGNVEVLAWYGNSSNGPNAGDSYGYYGTTSEVNNSTSTISIIFSDSTTWH